MTLLTGAAQAAALVPAAPFRGRRTLGSCYSISSSNLPVADGDARLIAVTERLPVVELKPSVATASAAGPGEQPTGDEPGHGHRNGSPLAPIDEAADRDGLELGKSAISAYMHLLSSVNDVGKWVCRPAPNALCPGTDTATENAGLGLEQDAVRPWSCSARRTSPRPRTHYGQGEASQRRTPVGGWRKAHCAQGSVQRLKPTLWRQTHYALGSGTVTENAV